MATEEDEKRADDETLPDSPLRAYKEGREEDVEGDLEDLESGDPERSQRTDIAAGDELAFPEAPKD